MGRRESSHSCRKWKIVRTEGGWKGEGFVESIPPEEQEAGRKLVLSENAYNLTGSVQAIYMENHTEEVELCIEQR